MRGHGFQTFHDVAKGVESDTLGSVFAAFSHAALHCNPRLNTLFMVVRDFNRA